MVRSPSGRQHRAVPDAPLYDPTRTGVLFSVLYVVLFSLMSLGTWAGWGGWYVAAKPGFDVAIGEALAVTVVNLAYGLLVIYGTLTLRPRRWEPRVRYPVIALVALLGSVPRSLGMVAIYSTPSEVTFAVADWAAGFAAGFVAVAAGVYTAEIIGRARFEEARRLHAARRVAKAVAELQNEEMRVRRMVADRLHGTLQYQLVTVTAGLDGIAAQLENGTTPVADAAAELRRAAERLEQIREEEVRSLSHAVFPSGIDLGLVHAVETMMRRLPPQIDMELDVGPALRDLVATLEKPLPTAERLIAVYAVEEGITNALRHGNARKLWVSMEIHPTRDPAAWVLEVSIDDDGDGLTASDPELSGLTRHADRLDAYDGSLELGHSEHGGARLLLRLPFNRRHLQRGCPAAAQQDTPTAPGSSRLALPV